MPTTKKPPGVGRPICRMSGAGKSNMAHPAIGLEPRPGVMLPCNVPVRPGDGRVEVCTIAPGCRCRPSMPGTQAGADQMRDRTTAVEAIRTALPDCTQAPDRHALRQTMENPSRRKPVSVRPAAIGCRDTGKREICS